MGSVLNIEPRTAACIIPAGKRDIPISKDRAKVFRLQPKEVDMMPGNWASPGNPTAYELRTTIHTCKRIWQQNQDALEHSDCDIEATLENIKVLERLYIILMDYLVE